MMVYVNNNWLKANGFTQSQIDDSTTDEEVVTVDGRTPPSRRNKK